MSERVGGRVPKRIYDRFEQERARREVSVSELLKHILERRYGISSECVALVSRDGWYICVWGRKNKPPQITKLAEEIDEKTDICESCDKTKKLWEEVGKLKKELAEGHTINMPSCLAGGRVRELDGAFELQCLDPDLGPYIWRSVEEFCKIHRQGANCQALRWNYITVQRAVERDKNR